MQTIRYNLYSHLRKLLHVLAPRYHPKEVTNTQEYKHQLYLCNSSAINSWSAVAKAQPFTEATSRHQHIPTNSYMKWDCPQSW